MSYGTMPECGHPAQCVSTSDEGTSYCSWCADRCELQAKLVRAEKERDNAIKIAMHYFVADPKSTDGRFCKQCGHYLTAPWHHQTARQAENPTGDSR